MLLIYRKLDNVVVEQTGTNSLHPLGPVDADLICIENVLPVHGGVVSDYGYLRLHDLEDSIVQQIVSMLGASITVSVDEEGFALGIKCITEAQPNITEIRAAQKAFLQTRHDTIVTEGFVTDAEVEDNLFHAKIDDTSISMWQVAKEYPAPTYPLIKDWNNVKYLDVPMEDVETIAYQVLGHRSALWLRQQRLEMLIDGAETVEAIQEINWETEV